MAGAQVGPYSADIPSMIQLNEKLPQEVVHLAWLGKALGRAKK